MTYNWGHSCRFMINVPSHNSHDKYSTSGKHFSTEILFTLNTQTFASVNAPVIRFSSSTIHFHLITLMNFLLAILLLRKTRAINNSVFYAINLLLILLLLLLLLLFFTIRFESKHNKGLLNLNCVQLKNKEDHE